MSHLVLVEAGVARQELSFERLTGESLTCLESYADTEHELYRIRQYGYHPEFGATLYEILIDWGESRPIGPRKAELGEILQRTELDLALTHMRKLYEQVTETTCTLVRHEGRVTRCQFKPKGEYLDPPANLEWLKAELLESDLV